jgi:ketosteroid isomerase-like protein
LVGLLPRLRDLGLAVRDQLPWVVSERGRLHTWLVAPSNLDLVRSIYAAWERGDFSSAEWAHPAIEFVTVGLAPARFTGVAGMAEAWSGFLSAWDELRTEAQDYREIDSERVLVIVKHSGRGKTSGLEIAEIPEGGANLFHIRDGKVTKLMIYANRDRALADLGLTPDTGT